MILPPNVDMKNSSTLILYLSSSMGSIYWDSLGVSYCDSVEPYLVKTSVSILVDVTCTSHLYPPFYDANVNLLSHEYASGSSSSSCGPSSSHLPIFHYDEDIMEAMATPDYPWDDIYHCAYFFP